MESGFVKVWCARLAVVTAAVLAAVIALGDPAGAASGHGKRASDAAAPRPAGAPVMAVVSLKKQHVTIYDADGWILRAPVSTGQKGRETPSGVFSVIQKEAEHHSNLYDDASMPHMQRITWSGIALHGGPLPGYAASHGCIRMPYGFAERLFNKTRLGMRVIIVPGDPSPIETAPPPLFSPNPLPGAQADAPGDAAEAVKKADESAPAAATDATSKGALEPVSVFISRKTQHLYVRRGFEPVLESAVTILDADRPIGTHVFTAVARTDTGLRWSVVTLQPAGGGSDAAPADAAKSALERIVIPQEVLDRIGSMASMASPRSSLIVSDEPLSAETGKGTEFVAVLSNEPQGGLAMRKHPPRPELQYARQHERQFYSRSPFRAYATW